MKRPQGILILIILVAVFNAFGFEMTTVPAGKLRAFWLTPVSRKVQKDKINDILSIGQFEAMKYPVTLEQYKTFLKDNPQWNRKNVSSVFADSSYLSGFEDKNRDPKSPMTSVTWFSARAFCHFYGLRFPTVNEWEYMAAASETVADANKDEKFLRRILDWYGETYGSALKPVGSIYRNMYGVWDIHGLIWEWVEDFNSTFVTGESREDTSFNKNLFCGSGSLSGADKENYAAFMRFAFRSSLKGPSSVWNLGFRCVK